MGGGQRAGCWWHKLKMLDCFQRSICTLLINPQNVFLQSALPWKFSDIVFQTA
jgi:hypothetical protein